MSLTVSIRVGKQLHPLLRERVEGAKVTGLITGAAQDARRDLCLRQAAACARDLTIGQANAFDGAFPDTACRLDPPGRAA